MIAIDSSAVVAVIVGEPEEQAFRRLLADGTGIVGAPTLVETRLVLESRLLDPTGALHRFLRAADVTIVSFDAAMFESAIDDFARYGKGRGHPAGLNFGDCLAYGVAKTHAVPLLFKGNDFVHTDLVPAYAPTP